MAASGPPSEKLARQVRLATERRDLALRLYEDLDGIPDIDFRKVAITENAEEIAVEVRAWLEVDLKEQFSVKDENRALSLERSD